MSEQAIETDEVIEVDSGQEVTEEVLEVAESDEEIEIVIEGEETKPTSKPVPIGLIKRFNKLNGKIDAAQDDAESWKQKALMAEAERDLYKTKANVKTELDPDEFDSDAEYQAAILKRDLPGMVDERAKALLTEQGNANSQTASKQALENDIKAHYERAEGLKVSDYEATEDAAIEIMGNDISKQIMSKSEKSDVVMYYLGKNPAKAQSLRRLMETDIVKGVLELGRLEEKVKPRPKRSQAPDPETTVDGGGGISKSVRPYLKGATFT